MFKSLKSFITSFKFLILIKSKYSSNSSTIDLFFKSNLESSTGCVAIFLSSNDEFSIFDNSSIDPVTS